MVVAASLASLFGQGAGVASLQSTFDSAETAADSVPLPKGVYECELERGELFQSRQGTPGYKMAFRVLDGEFKGRCVFNDSWLTPKAMPFSKRDLAKIGLTSVAQLEAPSPRGFVCSVSVVIHRDDDGTEHNRVRNFDVIRREEPVVDAFAPPGGAAQ
jgi:hypothetical protein